VKKIRIATLVLAAVCAAAWNSMPSARVSQKVTPETMKQLEGDFLKAALERGSTGYMSYYAEDAVELPNGADAIVGKANIAKGMGFLDDKNNRLTWSPVAADVSASGDLGYTWGNFEFRSKLKDGSETVEHGKYMSIWKRQPDDTWKVAVDMGNSGPKHE